MAEDYDKFKAAGADLVAISTDAQNYAWSMSQTTGARYQILSDSDHSVIASYGVLNPRERGGIAHPSAFLVDKEGVIRYAYVGKNPTDRPPDQILIEEIKKISAPK